MSEVEDEAFFERWSRGALIFLLENRRQKLVALRASLTAAEERATRMAKAVDDLIIERTELWKARERAEAVVEVVKAAQRDWLPDDDPISVAVRLYDEGKK